MREPIVPWRFLVVAVLPFVAVAATGCSHDFWYRTPRVAGQMQSPAAPSPYTLPPPAVRDVPYPGAAPTPSSGAGTDARLTLLPDPTVEEQMVLRHVNAIRRSRGLRELSWSAQLFRAAQEHSLEQNVNGYMGHDAPDPSRRTLVQRMNLVGYQGAMYGEVVAWGYRDAQAVVEGWMNSPEHRAILIDAELVEAGFSRVGPYWTGNFGSPFAVPSRAPAPPARASRSPTTPRAAAPTPRGSLPAPYVAPTPSPRPAPSALPPAPTPRPAPQVRPSTPTPAPAVPPPRPIPTPMRGG